MGKLCLLHVVADRYVVVVDSSCRKNLRLQMGRCPVRHVFPEALALLEQHQSEFESVQSPSAMIKADKRQTKQCRNLVDSCLIK